LSGWIFKKDPPVARRRNRSGELLRAIPQAAEGAINNISIIVNDMSIPNTW